MTSGGLDVARGAYGAALVLAPSRVLRDLAGSPLDRPALVVARVLGVRHVVQAAVLATHPRPRWRQSAAAVDAAHGASMLALARWSPRPLHRRLAVRSARMAGGFAAAQCIVGLRGSGAFPEIVENLDGEQRERVETIGVSDETKRVLH